MNTKGQLDFQLPLYFFQDNPASNELERNKS
jgi:hypothetical protein